MADYSNKLGRIAPNSANPEVAFNDSMTKVEQALTDVSGNALPNPTTAGQVLALADSGSGPAPAWTRPPASLPTGGTDGDVLTRQGTGTVWAAPATGGIKEAPSDGKLYGRQNAAWAEVPASGGGGGGTYNGPYSVPMITPHVADFSDVSQQYANPITAFDDADTGLNVTIVPSSGDHCSAILKPLPASGDWSVDMRMQILTIGLNYHSLGFALTDTNSIYMHIIGLDMPSSSGSFLLNWAHNRYKRNSGGGFAGGFLTLNGSNVGMAQFCRLKYTAADGVTKVYFSPNGKLWRKLGQITEGNIGGKFNRIGLGFGLNYNQGDAEAIDGLIVPHWKQSW